MLRPRERRMHHEYKARRLTFCDFRHGNSEQIISRKPRSCMVSGGGKLYQIFFVTHSVMNRDRSIEVLLDWVAK